MDIKLPRIMIAAPNSGSGKTTITCALLKALMDMEINPTAFKCGPDYIDPMFHSEVIGAKSRNLDLYMLSEDICKYLMAKNSIGKAGTELCVLEGVMGFYDGALGKSDIASSYHLAQVTKTPVILIVNGKGASLSIGAVIKGFIEFRKDNNIAGVIINKVSEAVYLSYKDIIEEETGVKLLGYFPEIKEGILESRHLGLVTASEIDDLQSKVKLLAEQAKKTIQLDELLRIANDAEAFTYEEPKWLLMNEQKETAIIAVAKDKAFSFYYEDSLELLEALGAKLIYFSPLKDKAVPKADGLILGGGYPELYARELSENTSMLKSIKHAIEAETPCIAECGGFMYLQESITDHEGITHAMVGAIDGKSFMTKKLNRFGYINLKAREDNLLALKGNEINAHEFHYSDSTSNGEAFTASKASKNMTWNCVHASKSLYAGYPHLHLWGNPDFALRFINKCIDYKNKRDK